MAFQKGHKFGNRFSRTNQPGNSGRKHSIVNEFRSSFSLEYDDGSRISKEDTYKFMYYILTCTMAQFETLARHPDLPVSVLNLMKAIMTDMNQGRITTVCKLLDWVFGKSFQPLLIKRETRNQQIPDKPMNRKDYEKLLHKLQGNK